MSRDKQIKEMAKHCHFYEEGKCLLLEDEAAECDTKCDMCEFAKRLYNADYRKAPEVAREIIDEFARMLMCEVHYETSITGYRYPVVDLAEIEFITEELKKKYTEGGE